MASIERTAYPQFKRNPVVRELVTAYTPTDAEVAFVAEYTRQPAHRLTLTILLKTFQRLGYSPVLDEVPPAVMRHIRSALKLRVQVKPANLANALRYRYYRRIRQFLQVRAYSDGGLKIAARAVYEAAAVMDNPADLINVAIEQLVRDRVELPCLCEFVWVLMRVYGFQQSDAADAIRALLAAANVEVNRPAVEAGLLVLDAGGDFADGVIAYEGNWLGGETFVSFDKKAVTLLSAQGQSARLL